MKYSITFTQYYSYDVEAETEDDAFEIAYKEFISDMRYPIANTIYDDYEIEEHEEN